MLPSIDTYLREEIKSKLKIILTNRYIIEEILKGIQPDVAENFIKKYAESLEKKYLSSIPCRKISRPNKEPYRDWETDRKSTRLNSSHRSLSRMPSSA